MKWRGFLLQESPCVPVESTGYPQMHVHGLHISAPNRIPAAIGSVSKSSNVVKEALVTSRLLTFLLSLSNQCPVMNGKSQHSCIVVLTGISSFGCKNFHSFNAVSKSLERFCQPRQLSCWMMRWCAISDNSRTARPPNLIGRHSFLDNCIHQHSRSVVLQAMSILCLIMSSLVVVLIWFEKSVLRSSETFGKK